MENFLNHRGQTDTQTNKHISFISIDNDDTLRYPESEIIEIFELWKIKLIEYN